LSSVPQKGAASVEVVEAAPNRLTVSGSLSFDTARRAQDAGLRIINAEQSREPLQVDCSGVTDSDSAGLAVLVDWLANATARGRKITFVNLPHGIRAAAKISDADSLLSS
jgi:phospholipid transport system transporter-binding protein